MKLYFNLSVFAQGNELRKGNEVLKNQCIEIDFSTLTKTQRDAIVSTCLMQQDELFFPDSRG